ncbi:MAG: hypothetical protein AB7U23_04990 [Dehalococcoidia bacterium]
MAVVGLRHPGRLRLKPRVRIATLFVIAAGSVLLGACYEEPPLELGVLIRPDGSGTVSLAFNDIREVSTADDQEELQLLLAERTSGWRFPRDASPYRILFFEHFAVSRLPDGWRFDAWKYRDGLAAGGVGPLTIRLTLPGRISAHNADTEKDGQLTWNISLNSTATLYAVTVGNDAYEDATNSWPRLSAVAIIVGLAVAGAFWRRHRRRS